MNSFFRLRYVKIFFISVCACAFLHSTQAQELNARVRVISDQMPVEINKRIFQRLETDLATFLNTRRWTRDTYEFFERIECDFILNLQNYDGNNTYHATLNIQGLRPTFNSLYLVSLLNIMDREITFRYIESQNIIFNDMRPQGSEDPLVSNLPALFAFYAYLIIGIDYDSFGLKDGYPYFQKAYNIVNNPPENNVITGWQPYQSRRNRYWIIDMFVNPSYNKIHDVYYEFYRGVMDNLYKQDKGAGKKMIECLDILMEVANSNKSNLSIYAIFVQGKIEPFINIMKSMPREEKQNFLQLIERIDPSNFTQYERGIQ